MTPYSAMMYLLEIWWVQIAVSPLWWLKLFHKRGLDVFLSSYQQKWPWMVLVYTNFSFPIRSLIIQLEVIASITAFWVAQRWYTSLSWKYHIHYFLGSQQYYNCFFPDIAFARINDICLTHPGCSIELDVDYLCNCVFVDVVLFQWKISEGLADFGISCTIMDYLHNAVRETMKTVQSQNTAEFFETCNPLSTAIN